jgi:hypothetical protein
MLVGKLSKQGRSLDYIAFLRSRHGRVLVAEGICMWHNGPGCCPSYVFRDKQVSITPSMHSYPATISTSVTRDCTTVDIVTSVNEW